MNTFTLNTHAQPGDIVLADVPFSEDRHLDKTRFAFVVGRDERSLLVRGIYSNYRDGRRPIPTFGESGLHHDSFLGSQRVRLPLPRVHKRVGETPIEFDPFDDFAQVA